MHQAVLEVADARQIVRLRHTLRAGVQVNLLVGQVPGRARIAQITTDDLGARHHDVGALA